MTTNQHMMMNKKNAILDHLIGLRQEIESQFKRDLKALEERRDERLNSLQGMSSDFGIGTDYLQISDNKARNEDLSPDELLSMLSTLPQYIDQLAESLGVSEANIKTAADSLESEHIDIEITEGLDGRTRIFFTDGSQSKSSQMRSAVMAYISTFGPCTATKVRQDLMQMSLILHGNENGAQSAIRVAAMNLKKSGQIKYDEETKLYSSVEG